ncbi:unnamed protein product [Euphydryas editha]|uniref:FLYWCH-type domain-containing protein n=1 Tax=Euphydryas editha TaxID=104508 RepID=A0AAU9TI41_EUPED|nr:unnamed protein product [Euphydryas editha]
MIDGTKRIVIEDYVFHKSYHGPASKNKRWRCSARQKGCKALVILDMKEKIIKRNGGRKLLMKNGYTFYRHKPYKFGMRWSCTNSSKCKSNLLVSNNGNLDIPEIEFVETFRLGKETVRGLIEELSTFVPSPRRNDGVSVETKILIALIFYASG